MSDKAKIEEAKREAVVWWRARTLDDAIQMGKAIVTDLEGCQKYFNPEEREANRQRLSGLDLLIKHAAATRWHPIADGLPTEEGMYLLTAGGDVWQAVFEDDEFRHPDDYNCLMKNVTAWMPLPAPFTEGETK